MKSQRFLELEGVRGLAALVVVFHHFLMLFYPYVSKAGSNVMHSRFEDNIFGTPLAMLYSGKLAVAVFFVLSGFVLSIAYFQSKDDSIIKKMASRRYLRLMLPALASVTLCYLLISLGVPHLIEQSAAYTHTTVFDTTWSNVGGVAAALYNGSIGIFTEGSSPYNSVLWTMMIEFFGSFLIFGSLLFFMKSKYRWLSYLALIVVTMNTWYLAFIIGMLIADMYASGILSRLRGNKLLLTSLAVIAVGLGSFPHGNIKGTAYENLSLAIGTYSFDIKMLSLTIGATAIILLVLLSHRLAALMKMKFLQAAGKYSFSFYLTHLAVLFSFSTFVFLQLQPHVNYHLAATLTMLATIPVLWVVTVYFHRFVDAPSILLSRYVADVYGGKRMLPQVMQWITTHVGEYQSARATWQARTIETLQSNWQLLR